jgi:hypothetical protein
MTSVPGEGRRAGERGDRSPVSAEDVQRLIDGAQRRRARSARLSLDHGYYAGVEAAARQSLDSEDCSLCRVGWLDRHNPGFVSGYIETAARLASEWSAPLVSGGQPR